MLDKFIDGIVYRNGKEAIEEGSMLLNLALSGITAIGSCLIWVMVFERLLDNRERKGGFVEPDSSNNKKKIDEQC